MKIVVFFASLIDTGAIDQGITQELFLSCSSASKCANFKAIGTTPQANLLVLHWAYVMFQAQGRLYQRLYTWTKFQKRKKQNTQWRKVIQESYWFCNVKDVNIKKIWAKKERRRDCDYPFVILSHPVYIEELSATHKAQETTSWLCLGQRLICHQLH